MAGRSPFIQAADPVTEKSNGEACDEYTHDWLIWSFILAYTGCLAPRRPQLQSSWISCSPAPCRALYLRWGQVSSHYVFLLLCLNRCICLTNRPSTSICSQVRPQLAMRLRQALVARAAAGMAVFRSRRVVSQSNFCRRGARSQECRIHAIFIAQ